VICGLSGGVDSAVAAALVQRAVGDQLICVFVDHGLLRAGEAEQVETDFVAATGVSLKVVDARQQFLDALADVRSVGVQGDGRSYGHPVVLRPVSSEDAMTADWTRVPYEVLEKISTRITNEVREINRVVLDVTSKPPGTIEWE
jgi:GMP synthase PP-ATPase subunit